jgi:hypothetical protein
MNFTFRIRPTIGDITKPYLPTKLEIWIGKEFIISATEDEPEKVMIPLQTETTEALENGVRIERRIFQYEKSILEQAVERFDFGGGPILNPAVVNMLIAEFNLEIIEQ